MTPSPGRLRFVDHTADDILLWLASGDQNDQLLTTRPMWAGQLRDLISADLVRRHGDGPADVVTTAKGDARVAQLLAQGRARTGQVAA